MCHWEVSSMKTSTIEVRVGSVLPPATVSVECWLRTAGKYRAVGMGGSDCFQL